MGRTFQSYEKFSWIEIDRTRNIPVCTERVINRSRCNQSGSVNHFRAYATTIIYI